MNEMEMYFGEMEHSQSSEPELADSILDPLLATKPEFADPLEVLLFKECIIVHNECGFRRTLLHLRRQEVEV